MSRITLRALLAGAGDDALRECGERWCAPETVARWCNGHAAGKRSRPLDGLLAAIAVAMEDEQFVLQRVQALPRKLQDLLESFLGQPGSARTAKALFQEIGQGFKNRFDLEASLAALQREGFLFTTRDRRWSEFDQPAWVIPGELADCVLGARRRRQSAVRDMVTLQGFLDARHFRERAAPGPRGKDEPKAAEHARKIYKLYLLETQIASRLDRLPARVRAVVDTALVRHGGIVGIDELAPQLGADDLPDLELCRKCLEDAMLGTCGTLDLARFGIQPVPRALVLFHEVVLFALRRHGEANRPEPADVFSCGVDFVTNTVRFLRELRQSKVQFTADGELFKASHRRIAGLLLPNPGGFLEPEAMLGLLYRFCLHRRFIDRRGERALRPTEAGLEFERAPLAEQVRMLLSHFVEDRTLPGEQFHQVRLRRLFLRLLRRSEPMQWQDLTILPFLARNAWLSQLDVERVEEFFAARFQGGSYTPTESPKQMVFHLLQWVKRRLYPLGLVDLGQCSGRTVALRLSKLGQDLLDAEPASKAGGTRSSVIVNPDFEIVLFPGDDVHEAVHQFDRFSIRLKSDHVHQFRLEKDSVRAGLADGLDLGQIVQILTDRARAPIPQNVLYTLEEWAGRG
jgi:hypothetical protein